MERSGIVFWRTSGPERAKSHIFVLYRATGSQPHPYFRKFSPLGIDLYPLNETKTRQLRNQSQTYASHVLFKRLSSSMEIAQHLSWSITRRLIRCNLEPWYSRWIANTITFKSLHSRTQFQICLKMLTPCFCQWISSASELNVPVNSKTAHSPPPRAIPGHLTRVKLRTVGNLTQNEARPVGHLTFVSKRLSAVGNKRISQFFDSAREPRSRVIVLVDTTWVFLLLSFYIVEYALV